MKQEKKLVHVATRGGLAVGGLMYSMLSNGISDTACRWMNRRKRA